MYPLKYTRRSVVISVSVICSIALPLAAQTTEPPYFGPPGMHANTVSGLVDTDGTPGPSAGDSPAYFGWMVGASAIDTINPWQDCAPNPDAFIITPYMTGEQPGVYVEFQNSAFLRGFTFNNFDPAGNPVGGYYYSEFGSYGFADLEKTDTGQDYYDLIHLWEDEPGRQLDVVLPLVMHDGNGGEYIGVGNIANLGVIGPCGSADANTDIMIPMGTYDGRPAIIFDLEGDGSPTVGFLPSAPLGASQQQQPNAIPTLGTWGIAILAVSLLAIGLMILRWSGGAVSL